MPESTDEKPGPADCLNGSSRLSSSQILTVMLGLAWIWACVTYIGLGLDVLHSGSSWPTNTTDNDFNSVPLSSLVLFPIKFYLSGKARKQVFLNLLGKFDFFEHLHLHEKPGSWKTGSLNKETCLDFHLFSNPHKKWFELKLQLTKCSLKRSLILMKAS